MNKPRYNQRKANQGAAMIELAFVFIPLLVVFIGIVEFGRAIYQQALLNDAVTTAARYMARGYNILDADCDEIEVNWDQVKTRAQELAVYGVLGGSDPILPGLELINLVVEPKEDPADFCVITVSAPNVCFKSIVGDCNSTGDTTFFGLSVPLSLNAEVEERYIGT